jgi:hypothetical protein
VGFMLKYESIALTVKEGSVSGVKLPLGSVFHVNNGSGRAAAGMQSLGAQ